MKASSGYIDGNRRWAQHKGLAREYGEGFVVEAGVGLFEHCRDIGIKKISVRLMAQWAALSEPCMRFANEVKGRSASCARLRTCERISQGTTDLPKAAGDRHESQPARELRVGWGMEGERHKDLRLSAVSSVDLIVR